MPVDYKKYPPNWLSEIRPRILQRANNKCEFENCGLEHLKFVVGGKKAKIKMWFKTLDEAIRECGEDNVIIKPIRVILTIAHLDHDETNHEVKDERLMAMCQLHHLKYDAQEKYNRRKLKNKL